MKKTFAFFMALLLCINLLPAFNVKAEGTDTKTVDATIGALHVDGTHLVDKEGNVVVLRGVSTHGLSWFPQYVNKKLFKELREKWGVNVVRLAMYTAEYNGYCTGDKNNRNELKKLIKKGVQYATENNLYVIIDWHILSDGNPKTHKKSAGSFFTWAAKEFKDNTNVLYEICNEPNGGTTWSTIKSYAKYIIPKIRKYDDDAVILVGTPTWSQEVDKAAKSPLTDYDNIMYTMHFYAATHKKELRERLEKVILDGLPVFISEFGICDASGSGAVNNKEANKWIKLLEKHEVSYVCWNLSNKNETSSLIKSSVTKTNGIKRTDLSSEGKWFYDLLQKK